MDIAQIKKAFKTLSFEDRVSLCDEQGVHFAYLEAVLNQPGDQQSSFTADAFTQLVQRAATRFPALSPQTAPEWLDLPALHARLLPLAQAAGHEKLLLSVAIGDGLPCYEADATGGPSGFRRYVGRFDYGDTPSQFEGRLTELLQQQATYRTTTQPTSHAA